MLRLEDKLEAVVEFAASALFRPLALQHIRPIKPVSRIVIW